MSPAISWRAQNRLHRRYTRLLGAATPAQQSDGGDRAGAVRFYLGTFAHATLLPGAIHTGVKGIVRGEQHSPTKEETQPEAQDSPY